MRLGTIYSASDKSLFDALSQRNVTNADLRELFLTRGILVSADSSRKLLASHFSRLFHDYRDYQALAKLFGGKVQRERISTVRIATESTLKDFQAAAIELKNELEQDGAVVKVSSAAGSRLDVEVKYTKTHFNRSEFRQVTTKNATISLFIDADGLVVHSPLADEVREWVDELAKKVREKTEKDVVFDEIRLPPSMDSKTKTSFLKQVARKVKGFTLRDVSDVYVTKPKDLMDDDGSNGSSEIRIDKASLRGLGVLESPELRSLEDKHGFYVSRIIWTAMHDEAKTDIYEFEAQFARPDECSDFAYLPRGFYKYLSEGIHNSSRTGFSAEEEMKFGALIEAAARETFASLPGHSYGKT